MSKRSTQESSKQNSIQIVSKRQLSSRLDNSSWKLRQQKTTFGLGKEVGVTRLAEHDNTINGILENPVKCGYLLNFSQSEHNEENMVFLLEIDKFKDLLHDNTAWSEQLTYKCIDDRMEDFLTARRQEHTPLTVGGTTETWPSKKTPYYQAHSALMDIWNNYICSAAPKQICIPARVLSNTIYRIENFHIYGPYVFDETIADPVKTIRTDVLPRFLISTTYTKLRYRLDVLFPLPAAEDLHLKLPSKAHVLDWPDSLITVENLRNIKLYELFHDRILYLEFLEYAQSIYSEENVYFGRALAMYEYCWKGVDPNIKIVPIETEEMAWTIFRFFVCTGASFEVGMNTRRKKELKQILVHPTPTMFNLLEKSNDKIVRDIYNNFSFTKPFQDLPDKIKAQKKEIMMIKDKENHKKNSFGCLPFMIK